MIMVENKMIVVIAVLLVILAGIAIYLFSMDMRTRKLAAELKSLKKEKEEKSPHTH